MSYFWWCDSIHGRTTMNLYHAFFFSITLIIFFLLFIANFLSFTLFIVDIYFNYIIKLIKLDETTIIFFFLKNTSISWISILQRSFDLLPPLVMIFNLNTNQYERMGWEIRVAICKERTYRPWCCYALRI